MCIIPTNSVTKTNGEGMLGPKYNLRSKSIKTNTKEEILFDKLTELDEIRKKMHPQPSPDLMEELVPRMADCIAEALDLLADTETVLKTLTKHKAFVLQMAINLSYFGYPHIFNKILKSINFDIISEQPQNSIGDANLLAKVLTDEEGRAVVPNFAATPICVIFEHTPRATFDQMVNALSSDQKKVLLVLLWTYQNQINLKIFECLSRNEQFSRDMLDRWTREPITVECYAFIFSTAEKGNLSILKSFLEDDPTRMAAITRHFPFYAVSLLKALLLSPLGYDSPHIIKLFESMDIFNTTRIDLKEEFAALQSILRNGYTINSYGFLNSPWVVLGQFWHHPDMSQTFKKDIAQYLLQYLGIDLEAYLAKLPLTPLDYSLLSMDSFDKIRNQLAKDPTRVSCTLTKFPLLHWAISSQLCDPQNIDVFLALGFSLKDVSKGKTPLHVAAQNARTQWCKVLLENNADLHLCSEAKPEKTENSEDTIEENVAVEPDNKVSTQSPFCLLMGNKIVDEDLLLTVLAQKPNLNYRNEEEKNVKEWMEDKFNLNYPIIQHLRKTLQQESLRFIAASDVLAKKLSYYDMQMQLNVFPRDIYYKILSYCFPYQRQEKLAPIVKKEKSTVKIEEIEEGAIKSEDEFIPAAVRKRKKGLYE